MATFTPAIRIESAKSASVPRRRVNSAALAGRLYRIFIFSLKMEKSGFDIINHLYIYVHKRITAMIQLQLQQYASAPAEPCYELHTGHIGTKMPTRHPMVHFCRTFGALAPSEWQGYQHQGWQRDGAHSFRAPASARPHVVAG
jgi:hypothetical protein